MGFRFSISFPSGDPRPRLAKLQAAVYDGLVDGLSEVGDLILTKAARNLTDAGRVDQGILRGSLQRRTIGYPTSVEARVEATAAHAIWVERGRHGSKSDPSGLGKFPEGSKYAAKAAWPPVDAIRAWVSRHARILAPSGRTKSGRARKAAKQDIDALAFLIGRKIAERGIAPSPFLVPALDEITPRIKPIIAARVQRRVAQL